MRLLYTSIVALALAITGCGGSDPAPAPASPAAEAAPAPAQPKIVEPDLKATTTYDTTMSEAPAAQPAAEVTAPVEGGVPVISSPEPVYNFGEMDNTLEVKHDFVVKNTGNGVLEIKDVKTSCGCTVAALKKKSLNPGEETQVSATFKLQGKQGPQTKTITVTSNDPATAAYQLKIEGTALAAVAIEPKTLAFGMIEDDQPKTLTATITATKPELSFKITGVESTSQDFEIAQKEVTAGKSYEVSATLKGGLKPGNYSTRIQIKTDHPEHSTLMVSAFAQVVGALRVSPDRIQLRYSDEPGKVMNMQMQVSGGRVKTFTVTDVVVPIESIKATIEPHAETFLIKLADIPLDDTLEGKSLIIKTDVAGSEEITVPFTIFKPNMNRLVNPQAGGAPAVTLGGAQPAPVAVTPAPAPAPAPAEAAPAPAPQQ
jgi:hypothetical protein